MRITERWLATIAIKIEAGICRSLIMWAKVTDTLAICEGYQLRKINNTFNLFTSHGYYIGSGSNTAAIDRLMAIPYPEQQSVEDWLTTYLNGERWDDEIVVRSVI